MTPSADPSSPSVALVTGAGQGIGRAIALAFARDGIDVVVNDREVAGAQVAAEIEAVGRRALFVQADVTDRTAMQEMFAQAVAHWGHVDHVVSNAAWMQRERVADASWEGFRRTIEVNQFGLFHVCQAAALTLINGQKAGRPPGSITVIGSVHAKFVFANNAAYAMSKAAANHFARVLAKELAPYHIRVNTVNPGWTDTPGERRFMEEDALQAAAAHLPLGRLADPEEIAEAVLYLATRARYVTGSEWGVDGGIVIAPETVCEQR